MSNKQNNVILVKDLYIEYGKGARKLPAVNGITFSVEQGDVVGFIGPNGAGKTSTIKAIMGFIFPFSGEISVFGEPAGRASSRKRIGYLPEVSLYYQYMKAGELLELYGGLHGMGRSALKKKIPEVLETVGLAGKGGVLLKNFSKGQQQRLGIAQAIIADCECLILDELSSGLDPIGRYDLRSVLMGLKDMGRTIFFSSHELTEVENLCSKVIVINKGKICCQGTVDELLAPLNRFEIEFSKTDKSAGPFDELCKRVNAERDGEIFKCIVDSLDKYTAVLQTIEKYQAKLVNTRSKRQSLEEFFIKMIGTTNTKEDSGDRR